MKKHKTMLKTMKRLLAAASPQKTTITGSLLMGLSSHFCTIAFMTTGAVCLSNLAEGGGFNFIPLIIMAALAAGRALFRLGEQYLSHQAAFRLLKQLRIQLFKKISELSPGWMTGENRGDLCASLMADVELVEVFFAHTIVPAAIGIVVPAAVLVFTGSLWPVFPLILAPLYLFAGWIFPFLFLNNSGRAGKEYRCLQGVIQNFGLETVQALPEIISLGAEKPLSARFAALHSDLRNAGRKLSKHEGAGFLVSECCAALSLLLFTLSGLSAVKTGGLSAGSWIIGTVTGISSFGPIFALTAVSTNWLTTLAAAERIFRIMDIEPPVTDTGLLEPSDGIPVWDKVDFSYNGCDKVLRDFSLEIDQESLTMITGPSGCGKSTAVNLLLRYWDPDSGTLRLGDRDIRKNRLDSHRSSIGHFAQETHLFSLTIAENIALAAPGASREEIKEAAKKAAVDKMIENLPSGYDTPVAELGSSLSSGERQRIGLARLFLQNKKLMLIDEPTSRLDTLSEAAVMKALLDNREGRTIIMITHRQYLNRYADRLVNTVMLQDNDIALL